VWSPDGIGRTHWGGHRISLWHHAPDESGNHDSADDQNEPEDKLLKSLPILAHACFLCECHRDGDNCHYPQTYRVSIGATGMVHASPASESSHVRTGPIAVSTRERMI
jgi:hypothetical protein